VKETCRSQKRHGSVLTFFPESLLFQSKRYLLHDVWPVLCVESLSNWPYHSFDRHFDGETQHEEFVVFI